MEVTLETIIINIIQWINESSYSLIDKVLPDGSTLQEILSGVNVGIEFVLDLLNKINFLVPVPLIFSLCWISFSIDLVLFIAFIGNWVIKKVFDVIP